MRAIPPIAKLSEALHRDVELAVRRFPRYHRYNVGADLRRQMADVRRLVDRAWRDREHQLYWTGELVWAIDELRVTMQLGSQLHAFASFAQFETLIRQLEQIGRQVGGWLQLDVHNFFNSIHRPTLWAMLKPRLQRARLSPAALRATHALLRCAPLAPGVRHLSTQGERERVPAHKRLENAPPGCGLPIGNRSSQFFANVYLDALDQFVKHSLRVRRYLRYVDDFVLVHHDRAQLLAWQTAIVAFLAERLHLSLKPEIRLRPLGDGIDFLGYVVYPTHVRVRRRVVDHACAALQAFQDRHVTRRGLRATPSQLRAVIATWRSYEGHLQHANARRLERRLRRRFPWLAVAIARRRFPVATEGRPVLIPFRGTKQ